MSTVQFSTANSNLASAHASRSRAVVEDRKMTKTDLSNFSEVESTTASSMPKVQVKRPTGISHAAKLVQSSVEELQHADSYSLKPRERSGLYEQIFPFSDKSERLATELNRFAGQAIPVGASDKLKSLVEEVR